jgi:hypothetical protein
MYGLSVNRDLVVMTTQAERSCRCLDQLYPRYVFGDPDFMARQAAHLNRSVDMRTLALRLMTFKALCILYVLLQRDRMLGGQGRTDENYNYRQCRNRTA